MGGVSRLRLPSLCNRPRSRLSKFRSHLLRQIPRNARKHRNRTSYIVLRTWAASAASASRPFVTTSDHGFKTSHSHLLRTLHASPRNARKHRNRTSYIVHRTSYMGGVSRLRLPSLCNHVRSRLQDIPLAPAPHPPRLPAQRAQTSQSYIVHRTSYIGRPRLPPPPITAPEHPARTCSAKSRATRAIIAIVHRTSYFVHRQRQLPPSYLVHSKRIF